ncbi:MAG: SUMF1/EgtB/PvdO family nonheme iron enzyme [Nitrospinae bacterium]|nr:SUMF1/EgtB/PvdO family nonheme iron enzyme [Nitrospinota bacterium]
MVEIPAGDYKSGPSKKTVKVEKFSIDTNEVTNAQYKEFRKEFEIPAGKEKHPVAEISYFDAEAYCKAVGKRLPTRNEWEKAARGTDDREYPWGSKFEKGKANTLESEKNGTTPVGSYPKGASQYGVMDMAGNLWEWVDAWDSGEKKYRIAMGGSYFEDGDMSKVYTELKSIPDDQHEYMGFRCAK